MTREAGVSGGAGRRGRGGRRRITKKEAQIHRGAQQVFRKRAADRENVALEQRRNDNRRLHRTLLHSPDSEQGI